MELEASGGFSAVEAQRRIRGIWQSVLGIDDFSSTDDFFELGGHSMSASQVIARIRREWGVEVSLSSFFEHPTVAEQAELVVRRASGAEGTDPG
jgi:acyl carrier protein